MPAPEDRQCMKRAAVGNAGVASTAVESTGCGEARPVRRAPRAAIIAAGMEGAAAAGAERGGLRVDGRSRRNRQGNEPLGGRDFGRETAVRKGSSSAGVLRRDPQWTWRADSKVRAASFECFIRSSSSPRPSSRGAPRW